MWKIVNTDYGCFVSGYDWLSLVVTGDIWYYLVILDNTCWVSAVTQALGPSNIQIFHAGYSWEYLKPLFYLVVHSTTLL